MKLPVHYVEAKRQLALVVEKDEAKGWVDRAAAMETYAVQARDPDIAERAIEIKRLAERRIGELMALDRAADKLAKPGNPNWGSKNPNRPTLADQRIDKNLAKRARAAAKMTDDEFAEDLGNRKVLVRAAAEGRKEVVAAAKVAAAAARKAKRSEDEDRVMLLVPKSGKYKTLVIDPPWDYGALSIAGRAAPRYATMSHEELLALDVPAWADDNCHLYLWTTNNFITRASELMKHWGFQHKTVLTWVKPRWGLGSYFRNSTEQVLFGVKGELRTRSDSIATHFEAPLGDHSEKPGCFYDDIVRVASYPPYGEVFQRTEREWIPNLFEEKDERLSA
jgi:N6-adenosine-specific RNA methylase IME4